MVRQESLILVRGDRISKEAEKIAKEKGFRGTIIWLSWQEALEQHTPTSSSLYRRPRHPVAQRLSEPF